MWSPRILGLCPMMSKVLHMQSWPTPGGTVPREIYSRYGGFSIGLPTPLFIILGAVLLWMYIDYSRLGVRIRAVGGNPRNAFLSNIKPERIKLAAFTIAGFFTSMAGLCLTAFTASGDPWIGAPYSLKSMATVILGGCLFDTGWGNVGGAVSGSLFFIIVSNIVFFAYRKYSQYRCCPCHGNSWTNPRHDII